MHLCENGCLRGWKLRRIDLVIGDARTRDQDRCAIPVDRLRKVSLPLQRGGSVELLRASAGNELTIKFLTPEEEQPVLNDRSADLVADVVVAVQRRRVRQVSLELIFLVEPLVGVEAFVTVEEAPVTMPLVVAALGHQRDLAAGGFSKLRLVVRCQHFYFFNRIRIDRDVSSAVVPGIDVGCAVDRHLVLVRARSVDVERVEAAGSRGMAVKHTGNSGHELHVVQHVAAIDGDIVQLLAGHDVGALSGVRLKLDLADVRSDRHLIRGRADRQHERAGIEFSRGIQHKTG